MNRSERLQLDKMIKENNVQDFTKEIREKRHSKFLREDVSRFLEFKKKNAKLNVNNPVEFERLLISKCQFLFTYYTDIFNRMRKDELDLGIFNEFINILERIENSEFDQHEGSFEVGKLLKKIYIDSALKKADKLNKSQEEDMPIIKEPKNISWSEFKKKNLKNKKVIV
jgi:hypothetical protein